MMKHPRVTAPSYFCYFILVIAALLWNSANAQNANELSSVVKNLIQKTSQEGGNFQTLFEQAKKWQKETNRQQDAIDIYKYLADHGTNNHVPSMAQLGNYYAQEGAHHEDLSLALQYFVRAAKQNHHASMYNAGRTMAQTKDWVGALAYTRAATTLHETHPEYAQESITRIAFEAFVSLSQGAAYAPLSLRETADVFLYGSLHDVDEAVEALWTDAILALIQVNETFVSKKQYDYETMEQAAKILKDLWEGYSSSLSPLQQYLILTHANGILGPLSAKSEEYLSMAAACAEALALLPYCGELAASATNSPPFACFNHAVSNAMAYYRRLQDDEGVKRTLALAQSHPSAATHWALMSQSPAVHHAQLTARPLWEASEFLIAEALQVMYSNKAIRQQFLEELSLVKQLETTTGSVDVDAMGKLTRQQQGWGPVSFVDQVRSSNNDGSSSLKAVMELVLFDGKLWNHQVCTHMPTLCKAFQHDPSSLCTNKHACATDGVILSLVRVRPETFILPHCGPTNARLVLHFPLEGSQGVELVAGNGRVSNYGDGNAVVVDESFEHSLHHRGTQDLIYVRAVLNHPDMALK